jgi:hypothetical protein
MSLDHLGADFRIGLAPIPVERWFEGGEADPAARKDALLGAQGDLVWAEVEGSRPAQGEALAMVQAWLGRSGDVDPAAPPLWAASRLVADDLCLMEPRDGAWTLTALSLCAGTFFTARESIGKRLDQLHGPVPGFADSLLGRVQRIFDRLPDDAVLERRNWTLVNDPSLFMPDPAAMRAAIPAIERPATALQVRTERQTIRRLPAAGAVIFSIRVHLRTLADILAEPEARIAFAGAWEAVMGEAGAPFRAYKQLNLYDSLVRSLLASEAG